jgi:hypothetical protein
MFIPVASLPPSLRNALAEVGYGRTDIAVKASEREAFSSGGASGCRSFAVMVNLATGEFKVTYGSWGGPNMFVRNAVDCDMTEYDIPANGAVIMGSEGGGRPTYASISVAPSTLAPMLPAVPALDEHDNAILNAIGGLKSGPYRKEALARIPGLNDRLDSLVAKGLLKRSSNGATSITTAGKNARRR